MAHSGKIFDSTPSGITLKNKRDTALQKCKENGHEMSANYQRINNKHNNCLVWECEKCGHTMTMDFLDGQEKGGALIHQCSGKSWL